MGSFHLACIWLIKISIKFTKLQKFSCRPEILILRKRSSKLDLNALTNIEYNITSGSLVNKSRSKIDILGTHIPSKHFEVCIISYAHIYH